MSSNDANFSPDGTSMEQVRGLLFGTQFKEIEVRMQRQEEQFQREMADARDTLKNRLDSLENFMKSETTSLLGRINAEKTERDSMFKCSKREFDDAIKQEQRERSEALARMAKDLAASEEMLERKLAGLSNTLDSAERELRQLLLTESGSLSAKIEGKYQQTLDSIRLTSEQIRHDMVSRSVLSSLFTETAVKLSDQWTADLAEAQNNKPAEQTPPGKANKMKEPAEGTRHD